MLVEVVVAAVVLVVLVLYAEAANDAGRAVLCGA